MEIYSMPSSATWADLAWNGSIYCAVTADGSGKCATSPDGKVWTLQSMPANAFQGISWNGDVFCAVASNSTTGSSIYTSTDGVTWIKQTSPVNFYSYGIDWNGSIFFSPDNYGSGYSSPDGITWTLRSLPLDYHGRIKWNGDVFCVVCISGNYVYTSPDGITWTQRTLPISGHWLDVAVNNGKFCLVTNYNSESQGVISSDGIIWEVTTLPSTYWSKITSNDTFFCAIQSGASISSVGISRNGLDWDTRTLPIADRWYAIGSDGTDIILLSSTYAVIIDDLSTFWTNFKGQTEILA